MRAMILFSVLFISSCSTLIIKNDKGFGNPYLGAEYSYKSHVCLSELFLQSYIPFVLIVTVPLGAIDFVSSAALDTLLLPADLYFDAKGERNLDGKICKFH